MTRRFTFALIVLIACDQAHAMEWPVATMVRQNEIVRKQAPVSGGYIRGVGYLEDLSATDVRRLYVRLRETQTTTLCLDVYRRDGSYGAEYVYSLPGSAVNSYAELPLQTKFPAFYSHVTSHDLAIVARIARDGLCPADLGPIVPTFWNRVPEHGSPGHLIVAIQAGDRDAVLHLGGKGTGHNAARCESMQEEHVASFDSLCEISELPPGQEVQLDVEACAFGECGSIQKATLIP